MISAIAITFNNEDVIEHFVKNVAFADEIIIVGAQNSDKANKIITAPHVKFISKNFDSIDTQLHQALAVTKNDWVILCDITDQISSDLAKEIEDKIHHNSKSNAFKIQSEFYFMGKRMKFGEYKNQKILKIIRKEHYEFNGLFDAQPLVVQGKSETLQHAYQDLSYIDFDAFNQRLTQESKDRAALLYKNNIRPNLYHLLLKPFGKFMRHYIFKLGAFDGKKGFILSYILAFAEFKCYLYLWLTYRNID